VQGRVDLYGRSLGDCVDRRAPSQATLQETSGVSTIVVAPWMELPYVSAYGACLCPAPLTSPTWNAQLLVVSARETLLLVPCESHFRVS
jgi:hypothetical protein